ncbi:MAG: hypothetical protein R3A80_10550 [Bdellovibrionota bacterium]
MVQAQSKFQKLFFAFMLSVVISVHAEEPRIQIEQGRLGDYPEILKKAQEAASNQVLAFTDKFIHSVWAYLATGNRAVFLNSLAEPLKTKLSDPKAYTDFIKSMSLEAADGPEMTHIAGIDLKNKKLNIFLIVTFQPDAKKGSEVYYRILLESPGLDIEGQEAVNEVQAIEALSMSTLKIAQIKKAAASDALDALELDILDNDGIEGLEDMPLLNISPKSLNEQKSEKPASTPPDAI